MANITASEVNKLRQMTGAGMMDCKKALTECDGDFDKAVEFLRKKGQKVAANRADKEAKEGMVWAQVNADNTFGCIVSLSCETDFVAKNDEFTGLVRKMAELALAKKVKTADEVKALDVDGRTVADHITDLVGKIGEKMEIPGYEFIEAGRVFAYNHNGNKLATLVGFDKASAKDEVGHNVAMQVAAMNPIALDKDSVPAATIETEKSVAREKTKQEQVQKAVDNALSKAGINPAHVDSEEHIESNTAKGWLTPEQAQQAREIIAAVSAEKAANIPEAMLENIVKGRIEKFYKENTLMHQEYIMDSKQSVGDYVKQSGDAAVVAFRRLQMGA
ncbi:MAG: translation elongation factor Ts [Bacteroidales bacterium]|nr:translation elongation factor Ts [Bacteroidales bacterium]MDE7072670.1 translation elongation factor Ts [Bacteroidales bacterium]